MTLTRGQKFEEKGNSKHGHSLAMSSQAWSDINNDCTILRLHDTCHNPKYKDQKRFFLLRAKFQLEGA